MKEQIAFRVEKDIRDWAEALLEERPGGDERIGEFLRAAMIRECERRDPEGKRLAKERAKKHR